MNQSMIKQNFFQRIELLFWNLAIHILSGSRATQKVVAPFVRAARRSKAASLSIALALCGAAGLVSGYLLFVVTH